MTIASSGLVAHNNPNLLNRDVCLEWPRREDDGSYRPLYITGAESVAETAPRDIYLVACRPGVSELILHYGDGETVVYAVTVLETGWTGGDNGGWVSPVEGVGSADDAMSTPTLTPAPAPATAAPTTDAAGGIATTTPAAVAPTPTSAVATVVPTVIAPTTEADAAAPAPTGVATTTPVAATPVGDDIATATPATIGATPDADDAAPTPDLSDYPSPPPAVFPPGERRPER